MTLLTHASAIHRPKRRRAKISLTPLIDVVFILLVFFMLASSFLDWRSILLSAVDEGPVRGGVEGAVLVDVQAASVRLAGVSMTIEALQDRIRERLAEKPSQKVLLKPAHGVDMQRLVLVLDQLDAAGARDVALMPAVEP